MDKTPEEIAADEAAAAAAAAQAHDEANAALVTKVGAKKVKARVLVDCRHGKVNQVAVVSAAELAADNAPEGPRELDASKAAVAYAESLLDRG